MKLVVGPENPGKEYEVTYHSLGFCVLDTIAEGCRADVTQKRFKVLVANTGIGGGAVILMKPQTFTNSSGEAIRTAMNFYKLSAQGLLMIYDDPDPSVEEIYLWAQGGAGGQNGTKNTIRHIGIQEFDRICVGIGKDVRIPAIDWALGKIRKEGLEDYRQIVGLARNVAIYSCSYSFMDTMSHFDRKQGNTYGSSIKGVSAE